MTDVHSGGLGVRLQFTPTSPKKKKSKSKVNKKDEEGMEKRTEGEDEEMKEGEVEGEGEGEGEGRTLSKPFDCFALKTKLSDKEVKDITQNFYYGSLHMCRSYFHTFSYTSSAGADDNILENFFVAFSILSRLLLTLFLSFSNSLRPSSRILNVFLSLHPTFSSLNQISPSLNIFLLFPSHTQGCWLLSD